MNDRGDTQALAVVRIGLGLLLLKQAIERMTDLGRLGFFGDFFHWPMVPWVPSLPQYRALLILEIAAAVLAMVGVRAALFGGGAVGIYLLLCDRLQFHHNRYSLFLFAILVSLTPCDRVWSLSSRGRPRVAELWAQRLAQLQLSIIYLASGGAKLFDADWRGGLMLAARVVRHADEAARRGVPRALLALLARPEVAGLVAKGAITIEIGLALALWSRRWRALALWVGVWFHLLIEGTSNVEGFSWLMWTLYALFASTEIRTRVLIVPPSRRWIGGVVRALDWLARFRIEEGAALQVVRADGKIVRGAEVPGALARALPLLFPLWPLLQIGGAMSVRFFPLRGKSASSAAR
jgi:Vitamin K-dependent gamma-carboxylase